MKFRIVCTAATAAALISGLSPVRAADATPSGPIRLQLTLKAGQTHIFNVTNETVFKAGVSGGAGRRTTNNSSATFELTVDRENPDGTYAIRVKPSAQTVTVDGKDEAVADASAAEVRAKLTRDGRYSDLTGAQKVPDSEQPGLDAESFLNTVFDKEVAIPSKPLNVGDGWQDKVDSPVESTSEKMTVNNKLVALDDVDGTPVARILHVIAEPLNNPNVEKGVSMTGTMEGGGLSTVNLTTGLPMDERVTLRLKMNITAENPQNASQKAEVGSEANIKIHIQEVPPDKA